jgi:hypothetical protein
MRQYRLRLTGPRATGARLSAVALADLLDAVIDSTRHALRLRVDGGGLTGATPGWLERASDFIVLPLEAGSTQVVFEAQTLAEAVPDRFAQVDFDLGLEPDMTIFEVLEESLGEALAGNPSSEKFDAALLKTFGRFGKLWRHQIVGVEFEGGRAIRLDAASMARIEGLQRQIPADQRTIVVGKLDQLHHSKRMFTIRTDDGSDLRGVLATDEVLVASLGELWGRRAQVAGTVKFKASGAPLLIEADSVVASEGGPSVLSKAPRPLFQSLPARGLHKSQGPRSGVSAIFGQWPGDETDEEVEALLAHSS